MKKANFAPDAIWCGYGYSAFFGARLPGYRYALYADHISVTTGIFFRNTKTIPYYRIAAKELGTNIIGRRFHCGCINLITRGYEVPNLSMQVKEPEEVMKLIDDLSRRERSRYHNKRKSEHKEANNC